MHNSAMNATPTENALNTLTARVEELEIKASCADDALDKLDQVIIRQQLQIDLLIKEITDLRQTHSHDSTSTPRNLRDELPPHF